MLWEVQAIKRKRPKTHLLMNYEIYISSTATQSGLQNIRHNFVGCAVTYEDFI